MISVDVVQVSRRRARRVAQRHVVSVVPVPHRALLVAGVVGVDMVQVAGLLAGGVALSLPVSVIPRALRTLLVAERLGGRVVLRLWGTARVADPVVFAMVLSVVRTFLHAFF